MSRTKTVSITATGGHTRVVVPTGYSQTVSIDLAGGGGGAGGRYYGSNGTGGNGGRITGNIALSTGDVLDVYIGDGGRCGGYGGYVGSGGAGGGSALIGVISGLTTVYPVTLDYAWSDFMNTYAVWVDPSGVSPVNVTSTITRYIDVSIAGIYNFQAECDNYLNLYVDGVNIINTSDFQSYYATSAGYYLSPGRHTITMSVINWGGPAGVAVVVYDPYGTSIWNTRTVLDPNTFSYSFRGASGGTSYGDGGYVYVGAGGGGGASAVFLNGNLLLVAGGGGGGGAEGGHGAGGTPGGDGGIPGRVGGSPYGGQGEPGSDGGDIAGTPGGGGGYNGGNAGNFVYYDDAPSLGANGGTNYYSAGNWSYSTYAGSGTYYNGVPGFANITFTELGSGKVKVAGQWKQITGNWVKVAGQWKQITNAYTRVAGEWKVVSGGVPISTTFSGDSYG
jgi:hypothetical protein